MKAEDIGLQSNELVLGKHSGKHGLIDRFNRIGITIKEEQTTEIFIKFKNLADKKKKISDDDLKSLVSKINN